MTGTVYSEASLEEYFKVLQVLERGADHNVDELLTQTLVGLSPVDVRGEGRGRVSRA